METKSKRGAEIRRRKPDGRNSETHEWGLEGWRHCQISHREKFEKAKLGVPSSLYPRIVRNARNGDERTRPNQTKSDQIKPNPTKSNQIRPNQTKSDQIKPNPTKSNQIRPNQTKSDQIKPNPTKSNQI